MPHHCQDSEYGCGVSRHHVLASKIVTSPSFRTLDTGDTDEFTFTTAGGVACFRGVRPRRQGKIAVAL